MSYENYHCPVCSAKIERELEIFLAHTDLHIFDVLQKKHPEWFACGGFYDTCEAYYRDQLTHLKS